MSMRYLIVLQSNRRLFQYMLFMSVSPTLMKKGISLRKAAFL